MIKISIYIDNIKIKSSTFPGGEQHINLQNNILSSSTIEILAHLHSSDDIMQLLLTVNAIHFINKTSDINLTIPYMPYARQDRICNKGDAFSIQVIAELINSLKCTSVTIFDPHSEVTSNLINNCIVISQNTLIKDLNINSKNIILVSPDAGSRKKCKEIAKESNIEMITASKIREPKTGKIINCKLNDKIINKEYIIIDDICDGGRTFIELAKLLKKEGAKKIYLYITHGIFSKGINTLIKHFNHIYCHTSFINIEHKKITIFNVGE